MVSRGQLISGVARDHVNQEKDHYYPTPLDGILPLIKFESFDGPIWEPACGKGHISTVLSGWGYDVISTDLVDRGFGETPVDFLAQNRARAPNIVTNPPFKLATDFIRQGLELNLRKMAFFFRIQILEGIERGKIFRENPPIRIHVFSDRVSTYRENYEGKAKGMQAFCWLVWEKGFTGKPTLDWI